MMINLNYEDVQDYKETTGITVNYTGELRRLVDIEFPDEMDADVSPPTCMDADQGLVEGLEVDSEDSDIESENSSDEEEESESE